MTSSDRELTYYFVGKGIPPSLDPESSDMIRNMVHMDHMIGTLLKEQYGNSGRTEPYLAERWENTHGGRVWDFFLRPGLKCEDGTLIDAPAFVKSFNRILKLYAKRNDLAAFNRLMGWEDFKRTGTRLEGIQAISEHQLRFLFDSPPDGLPEFLAMSFYGFYCDANFDGTRWKDSKHLVASGAYKLKLGSLTDDRLTMVRRGDFPLTSPEAPSEITIRSINAKDVESVPKQRSVFYYRQSNDVARSDGFQLYQGSPIFLTALVLSPHRATVFDRIENRRLFRTAVRREIALNPPPDVGSAKLYLGPHFYFSDLPEDTSTTDETAIQPSWRPSSPLRILRFAYSSRDQNVYTERVVVQALEKLGWPYELIDPDMKDPDFVKRRNTNREYDIRFATVDIGGSAENWVINMMFCSELAISFPDPTGRICQMVKEHEGKPFGSDSGEYLRKFEAIVADDSSVVPLYHTGAYWLVSSDIDFDKVLSPMMVVPRFDRLRFR